MDGCVPVILTPLFVEGWDDTYLVTVKVVKDTIVRTIALSRKPHGKARIDIWKVGTTKYRNEAKWVRVVDKSKSHVSVDTPIDPE